MESQFVDNIESGQFAIEAGLGSPQSDSNGLQRKLGSINRNQDMAEQRLHLQTLHCPCCLTRLVLEKLSRSCSSRIA
jgi:hypothetical protein